MHLDIWQSRAAPWCAVALALLGLSIVAFFVDVSPRVEGEFFFAEDDPQMQALQAVQARFPVGVQALLRVRDLADDPEAHLVRVQRLTSDLLGVDGVVGAYSVTTENAAASPLFRRVLLTPDPDATNIVLDVDDTDPELLLPRIEEVVSANESEALEVVISGVPVIVELIRRSLDRDLAVFSLSAILVFALLIGLVYRDAAVVVGTLCTCCVSVASTLLIVQALGVPIGLLTANLVTIIFVLTLSHVVFITGNWSRALESGQDRRAALAIGVRQTFEPSFWSMATTLLGFLSLLIATARPLRELGVAGAVGAVTALAVAYLVYPAFLGRWARARTHWGLRAVAGLGRRRAIVAGAGALVVMLAAGLPRLDTDPSLLSYFSPASEIRRGLDRIDADGGTSTLDLVVRSADGTRVDGPAALAAMEVLQGALEADSAVGVVLSPPVLIAHARTLPLAGLLPVPLLLDIASGERLGGVGLGYVSPDRGEARFALRIREGVAEPRRSVMARLTEDVRRAGLEPVLLAGLYDLQAQLGDLIASSLRIGIGGLLLLFLGVAAIVSRSARVALTMWLCLIAIPTVILGAFGHLRIAVDIITSPAANIALAIGADAMIHLVARVRTLTGAGSTRPWPEALAQVGGPVLAATGIVCAGFGIFVLSSFPPTRRFGLAVILGSFAAATMALVVLPRIAAPTATETP